MKTINVYVGKKDIKKGVSGSCSKCPIALALNKKGFRVDVLMTLVKFFDAQGTRVGAANLPLTAVDFVRNFDGDSPVKPFSFRIKAPV